MNGFTRVFKARPKEDTMCTVDPLTGKVENGDLHDQIMAKVDDQAIRKVSHARAKKLGVTGDALSLLE